MRKLRRIGCFVIMCWLTPLVGLAQFTETKEMTKEFKITPETRVELSNKYGKIDIKTWEKDSVVIEIKIRIEEKKLSKLEEAIKSIDFDITNSQHFLIVKTDVERNKSSIGKEIKKFKETLLKSDGNIQVDYTVWMPSANQLRVENKFGDVYIGDYMGEVEINLSNGNLKAHDLEGNVDLILNFADVTINKVENARLDCNYSDVYIKEAGSIRSNSKSSEFEFQTLRDLNADSRRDKFRIREAEMLEARSSFSNFRITALKDRLKIRADYGNIEIEETVSDFSDVTLDTKSTDVYVYFESDSKFNFDITHIKAEVDYCREMEIVDEESTGENDKQIRQTGYFGASSDISVKLHINANSGSINIRSN